jgi:threonine/homoserine/homoserine lactone efflux protein
MTPEEKIKEVEKDITKLSLIDASATIMLGLGLYAKFSTNGDALHPLLNNESVINTLLVVGASIMVWVGYKIFTLGRKKAMLKNEYNL